MRVKQAMQTKVDYLTPDQTIRQAAETIFGKHHIGHPVCGKNKKLIGFLTEQDILSRFLPSAKEYFEDPIHVKDFEKLEKKAATILALKVKQVMNKRVYSIHADEPLLQAESYMQVKGVSRLPVVDNKNHLQGILTKGDIFRAIIGKAAKKGKKGVV